MASWQSVVVHPLGLAGYALACVFGLVARFGPTAQFPWLAPVAVAMAVVALLGGLLLSLQRRQPRGARPSNYESPSAATQTTGGHQSPAIAHVKGRVSINYDGQKPKSKKT